MIINVELFAAIMIILYFCHQIRITLISKDKNS